jgi:hypothetical protein
MSLWLTRWNRGGLYHGVLGPRAMSANDSITLADGQPLLVYPNQQTFSESSACLQGAEAAAVSRAGNV